MKKVLIFLCKYEISSYICKRKQQRFSKLVTKIVKKDQHTKIWSINLKCYKTMKMQFTFWKRDFTGDAYDDLLDILKDYALKGEGFWYIIKPNFIRAYLPENEYEYIMNKVANVNRNK